MHPINLCLFNLNRQKKSRTGTMSDQITKERIEKWKDPALDLDRKRCELMQIVGNFSDGSFPVLDNEIKELFSAYICSNDHDNLEMLRLNLELLRIILRDKANSDLVCFLPVLKLLLKVSALGIDEEIKHEARVLLEADKCLVNLLFNSSKARTVFQDEPFDKLLLRISALNCLLEGHEVKLPSTNLFVYLKSFKISDLEELLLYDLKIAFVVSAQVRKLQFDCVNNTDKTAIFQRVVHLSEEKIKQNLKPTTNVFLPSTIPWKHLNEALKILFNFYHSAKAFELDVAQLCADDCSKIVQNTNIDLESVQNAINLLAVMPATLPNLCPKITPEESEIDEQFVQEGYDMRFVNALLHTFEEQIDAHERNKNGTLSEHLTMFLTALNQLCTEHKVARRFCRLKVIPPLKAEHVEHRPDVGATFRNKIIRLMTNPNRSGELASEFLFVLCKRSVSRLIKYCGFGHSAGLLANYGILGQALAPKHASDSEDSETEEYKQLEEKINPVTGYIPPPGQMEELRRQLESMSEEQKEYEMMKLVDCMDKLMDQGLIAPGTIGDDGRPRQVKHVAELIKDVKGEDTESSDDD